jgi:hypothetical protein
MNRLGKNVAIIASGLTLSWGGGELAGHLAQAQVKGADIVDREQSAKEIKAFVDSSTLTGTIGGLAIWGLGLTYFAASGEVKETRRRL